MRVEHASSRSQIRISMCSAPPTSSVRRCRLAAASWEAASPPSLAASPIYAVPAVRALVLSRFLVRFVMVHTKHFLS